MERIRAIGDRILKTLNNNIPGFSSLLGLAKHRVGDGLQAGSQSLKALLKFVPGNQSNHRTGLPNIAKTEQQKEQGLCVKTIPNTDGFSQALARLAKETWQNHQQVSAWQKQETCPNHKQMPTWQDEDGWQNYQQMPSRQDENAWENYQQLPNRQDEDIWTGEQDLNVGQEAASQEYSNADADQNDENQWQEYPQQPKQSCAPASQHSPLQINQIAGTKNSKSGLSPDTEPKKKQSRRQRVLRKKLLQTEERSCQQQLTEKLAIKPAAPACLAEAAKRKPVDKPVQIKSVTDADGWTTMVMQQISDDVVASGSAKIFNLTEEDIHEHFSRMITDKKEHKHNQKRLPKQKQSSKLGKIAVEKISSQTGHIGLITDIGKFLLDPEAVYAFERILKNDKNKGTLRRLNQDHSKLIDSLQTKIGKEPGVIGSIVMGHDGTVISSSIPEDLNGDEIAAWSFSAHVNSNIACQLLSAIAMYDLVLTGDGKDLIVSDFGGFLLVTLTDKHNPGDIARLTEKFDALRH